jgi:hypothetical protein
MDLTTAAAPAADPKRFSSSPHRHLHNILLPILGPLQSMQHNQAHQTQVAGTRPVALLTV